VKTVDHKSPVESAGGLGSIPSHTRQAMKVSGMENKEPIFGEQDKKRLRDFMKDWQKPVRDWLKDQPSNKSVSSNE